MTQCLYCRGVGPFNTIEHVVPESLGNDELVLEGCVCDSCQSYFGKEIEQYVLAKTPLAVWRTLIGISTKKGRLPTVDLSQPDRVKGILPDTHDRHDGVGFTTYSDGSISVDIDDGSIIRGLLDGRKRQFNLVLTPKKLSMLGRFLGKIGLGLLATSNREQAYHQKFDRIRAYARFGSIDELWPIFHFSEGMMGQWRKPTLMDAKGKTVLEEIECFSYGMVEVGDQYTVFRFSMGLDNWVITLNDPFPSPAMRAAFPNQELQLIWYSQDQWSSNKST